MIQPWFCDVRRQAKVIDRVASNSKVLPQNRDEVICNTAVKIWSKFDTYCLRRSVE